MSERIANARLIAAAPDLARKVIALEVMLGNLLAVVHRDGGQYQAEHGLEKTAADAERLSSERIALEAVIVKYASHDDDCDWFTMGCDCTCGLDAALGYREGGDAP